MKIKNLIRLFALAAAALACTLPAARAQTPAFTPVSTAYVGDSGYTEGYSFSLTAPMLVTGLGFYDYQQNGLALSHQVGLWNSAGLLLATLTVPSGTSAPLTGTSRYVNLTTPVTLAIGMTYTMGAYTGNGNDRVVYLGSANPTAGVTYGQALADNGFSSFKQPTIATGENAGYFGPNLLVMPVQIVPEPSTWAFVATGAGLLGFATLRRRRV